MEKLDTEVKKELLKAYGSYSEDECGEKINKLPEDGKLFILKLCDEMDRDIAMVYDIENEKYVVTIKGIERSINTVEDFVGYDTQPLKDAMEDFENFSFYDYYNKVIQMEKEYSIQQYYWQQKEYGGAYYD